MHDMPAHDETSVAEVLMDLLDGPIKNHNEIMVEDWLADLFEGPIKNHCEIVIDGRLAGLPDDMGHDRSMTMVAGHATVPVVVGPDRGRITHAAP